MIGNFSKVLNFNQVFSYAYVQSPFTAYVLIMSAWPIYRVNNSLMYVCGNFESIEYIVSIICT